MSFHDKDKQRVGDTIGELLAVIVALTAAKGRLASRSSSPNFIARR